MFRYDRDEVYIYYCDNTNCTSVCYDFICKLSEQTKKYLSQKNLE